jgi:hypothetical protein
MKNKNVPHLFGAIPEGHPAHMGMGSEASGGSGISVLGVGGGVGASVLDNHRYMRQQQMNQVRHGNLMNLQFGYAANPNPMQRPGFDQPHPFTPIDTQFPNDSHLLPIGPAPIEGMLGAFGMNAVDKVHRHQPPGMQFVKLMQGSHDELQQNKTRLQGINKNGEPTFERSLASDSLLLYAGDRPKTPTVNQEERLDSYQHAWGVGQKPQSDTRFRAISPANPERENPEEAGYENVGP